MQLKDLSKAELARKGAGEGIGIQCGPTVTRLKTTVPELLSDVHIIYGQYPLADITVTGADVCVDMRYTSFLRGIVKRQVTGAADRPGPFAPLPPDSAFVGYEMAQNWHIANAHNRTLLFHAACVANCDGSAILMPGQSGSGKSTLGIAMGYREWRYLGDEFAMYDDVINAFVPIARPASLKNQSIEALKEWTAGGPLSRVFENTPKGRMAYLPPPGNALSGSHPPPTLAMVIFPRFVANMSPGLTKLRPAEALIEFTNACVNFDRLSDRAFNTLARWAETIPAFKMTYPSLEQACETIRSLEAAQRKQASGGLRHAR